MLRGAKLMTAAGQAWPRADLLVSGARIFAIGPDLAVPERARVIDATDRWVTPGLIDASASIGAYPAEAGRDDGPAHFDPEVRAADAFWSGDPALRYAVSGGVTTIRVRSRAVDVPDPAALAGGHGVTLRLRPGRSAEEMRFAGAPDTLDLSCGGPARLRRALRRARAHAAGDALPGHALGSEALARVLRGDTLVQSLCARADEMLSRLELFGEFGIAPRAFHGAVEAYKIADRLASAGVGAVVSADGSLYGTAAAAALLERSGARVALQPHRPRDVQRLNQAAAFALAAGRRAGIELDRDRALRWITANPAWLLGIDERVGTLEPGKDADLVVWSADPFSVYARADLVFIEGHLVYDRASPGVYPVADFELGMRIDAP